MNTEQPNVIITTPKPWYMSRTIWTGIAGMVVAALAMLPDLIHAVLNTPEIVAIIPKDWVPYLMALASFLEVAWRLRTNQPVK